MPRTAQSPLFALIEQLGRQLGQQLAAAVAERQPEAPRVARRGRPARAASERARCGVDGCGRSAVAKGLCQNHYAKAKRLGLDPDALTAAQRTTLAQDGRALRFQGARGRKGARGGRK